MHSPCPPRTTWVPEDDLRALSLFLPPRRFFPGKICPCALSASFAGRNPQHKRCSFSVGQGIFHPQTLWKTANLRSQKIASDPTIWVIEGSREPWPQLPAIGCSVGIRRDTGPGSCGLRLGVQGALSGPRPVGESEVRVGGYVAGDLVVLTGFGIAADLPRARHIQRTKSGMESCRCAAPSIRPQTIVAP